jgi:Fe-S oxidoreductase
MLDVARLSDPWTRLKLFLVHVIGQVRIVKDLYSGVMHLLIFWGFTVQAIGTAIALTQQPLFIPFLFLPFPRGNAYLAYELIMDLAGLGLIVGTLMAIFHRYGLRPERLDNRWDDAYALALLLALPVLGFALEGLRILAVAPPWAAWSPVGNGVAWLLASVGVTPLAAGALHRTLWWAHAIVACLFVASIPFTKLSHLVTAPLNIVLKPLWPEGALTPIENIEEAEVLGVGRLAEFTSGQLLAFDACVRCGRCQAACPAYLSGADFSPKRLIQSLRVQMVSEWLAADGRPAASDPEPLIGGPVPESALWACSTCGACLQACPVFVQPMHRVIDLRRYLSLSVGKLPATVASTYRNIINQGNPWGISAGERTHWTKGLGVRQLTEGEEVDLLYYVGCCFAYDPRNQKVARAMVRLLQAAGVDFAILGDAETCCGETARRLGDEYLFQTLAAENIETLKKYRFNRIFTQCAHCFNTLKNEYPQFGGEFEVIHYTQLVAELLAQGRLTPPASPPEGGTEGGVGDKTITYHDSCYLGRYNGIYHEPREILQAIPGLRLVEMERSWANSFCCGGGGGQMWLETPAETRINLRRLEQAAAVEPDLIATACPYCLLMFDDALKIRGMAEQIEVVDLVELLDLALNQ